MIQQHQKIESRTPCPEATVTQRLIRKRGIPKRGIMKSLVSHVLNFKSWIKLICDKIAYTHCVINEFNPTFEIQNMGNDAFQNALFGNALFGNGNEDYSCLWAKSDNRFKIGSTSVVPAVSLL